MHRKSAGKRIELVPRDLQIFKLLDRYQYLRANFLHAFAGGYRMSFIKRLGHLYHEGYINRPAQQWQFANCRYMPAIYELDTAGERALREQGLIGDDSPLLRKGRMGAHRQFAHALMISDILASIELGVRDDPSLRFISWQDVIAKSPPETRRADNPFEIPVSISHTFAATGKSLRADIKIVPDGLFGLEYTRDGKNLYRFFALEADRKTMPVFRANLLQSSYLKKLLAYRQILSSQIHRTHFAVPNLFVLTVTTSEHHMKTIMALLNELTGGRGSTAFMFKSITTLGDFDRAPAPTSHILTAPWERAVHPPFLLSHP